MHRENLINQKTRRLSVSQSYLTKCYLQMNLRANFCIQFPLLVIASIGAGLIVLLSCNSSSEDSNDSTTRGSTSNAGGVKPGSGKAKTAPVTPAGGNR